MCSRKIWQFSYRSVGRTDTNICEIRYSRNAKSKVLFVQASLYILSLFIGFLTGIILKEISVFLGYNSI